MSFRLNLFSAFSSKNAGRGALCAVAALAFAVIAPLAQAQNNPTFTGGGKLSNVSNGSPAMATNLSKGLTCMVYQDRNTGRLAAVSSTNGTSWGNSVTTGNSMSNSIVTEAFFNGQFYILFATNTGLQETISPDCVNFTAATQPVINSPYGYNYNYQPGLYSWQAPGATQPSLYLSVNVGLPGGGIEPAVLSSTSGTDFENFQVPYGGSINSGTSLLAYTPPGASTSRLYLAFTQGANNLPVIAQTSDGSTWSSAQDGSFEVGGDPNLVAFTASGNTSPAIYLFGRSNYSANNLWVTATYDGSTLRNPRDGRSLGRKCAKGRDHCVE